MATSIRRSLLIAGTLVLVCTSYMLLRPPGTPTRADNLLPLEPPSFTQGVDAQLAAAASVIETEAGISAYFNAATAIDLDDVRDVFRTVEAETATYILGSVPVANDPASYYESDDVHVFVSTSGWFLAYYLAEDPAAKILDWRAYENGGHTNIGTRLDHTIQVVAAEASVICPGVTYYDFRHPNATHLLLVAEWVGDATDSFEVNIPGTFVYYERSWSLGTSDWVFDSRYKLDGQLVYEHDPQVRYWRVSYGTLTVLQLPPDEFHWIEVSGRNVYTYGGLALVYRVPQ